MIANVAESLRDFVRAEKMRLEHRQFGVAQMEEHFFLPADDIEYWLSEASSANALGRFHD